MAQIYRHKLAVGQLEKVSSFIAGVSSASATCCKIWPLAGPPMGDWLVRDFVIFGVTVQNWMPVALAMAVVAVIISWRSSR
jgi:hypothetical protein